MQFDLSTPEGVTTIAGTVLALAFIYFPGLRAWFTALEADNQAAINGALILLVAVFAVVGSCAGWFMTVACNTQNVADYIIRIVLATVLGVGVNRAIFLTARMGSPNRAAREQSLTPARRPKLLD